MEDWAQVWARKARADVLKTYSRQVLSSAGVRMILWPAYRRFLRRADRLHDRPGISMDDKHLKLKSWIDDYEKLGLDPEVLKALLGTITNIDLDASDTRQ